MKIEIGESTLNILISSSILQLAFSTATFGLISKARLMRAEQNEFEVNVYVVYSTTIY